MFSVDIRTPLHYMLMNKNHKTIFVQISSFFSTTGAMDVSAL